MNFAGGADLIVLILLLTKSVRVLIDFNLLFQSLVPNSLIICLNSSISIGSIGFETILLVFLKVLDVLLNPILAPPVLFWKVYYILKSDDCVNLPKPSLPAAVDWG